MPVAVLARWYPNVLLLSQGFHAFFLLLAAFVHRQVAGVVGEDVHGVSTALAHEGLFQAAFSSLE